MTEDQAKQKWCPFVRAGVATTAGETNSAINRVGLANQGSDKINTYPIGMCIASDCMAWRVSQMYNLEGTEMMSHGYCGLAGTVHDEVYSESS